MWIGNKELSSQQDLNLCPFVFFIYFRKSVYLQQLLYCLTNWIQWLQKIKSKHINLFPALQSLGGTIFYRIVSLYCYFISEKFHKFYQYRNMREMVGWLVGIYGMSTHWVILCRIRFLFTNSHYFS